MKRLISAALVLSLLGATAASAAPVNRPIPVRDYRYHDNDNGAAIAAGIGFVALAAILASQNNHDRGDWYYRERDRGWNDRGDWRFRDRDWREHDWRGRDDDRGRYFDNRYDAYSHGYRSW